jgi:hypothetical protein
MSTNKITYLDQIIPNKLFVFNNPGLLVMDSFDEIKEILDRGETLDPEIQDKLDEDFTKILGERFDEFNKGTLELRDEFNNKVEELLNEQLQNELNREIEELANEQFQYELNREVEELLSNFSNLGIDYTTILEIIDTIINFINQFIIFE